MPRDSSKRRPIGTRILSQERRELYRSHAASKEGSLGANSRRYLSPDVMQQRLRGLSVDDETHGTHRNASYTWLRASQKMTERHPGAWGPQSAKSENSSIGALSSDKTGVRKGINMMKMIIQ